MKEQFLELERSEKPDETGSRVVGISCTGSRTPASIPVKVLSSPVPVDAHPDWWTCLRNFGRLAFGNLFLFCCLACLFCVYYLSAVIHFFDLQRGKLVLWNKWPNSTGRLGLVLAFALLIAGTGCVGYVGDGYGGVAVDAYVPAPDVYVFGGHEHHHFDREYSHRGWGSRGGGHWHR